MADETINQQSEDTSPTTDDFIPIWDTTTGTMKKVSVANLIASFTPGYFIQLQRSEITTSTTFLSATAIPMDDTIPQSSEGQEVTTVTITPKYANSNLYVRAGLNVSSGSGVTSQQIALFRDSTANAIAASFMGVAASSGMGVMQASALVAAGSVAATTFKVRLGSAGGTSRINGEGGARRFGGVSISYLEVVEVKV